MKKKILAVVIGSLCLSTVYAQTTQSPIKMSGAPYSISSLESPAATTSMTIYGRINTDMSIGSKGDSSSMSVIREGSNGSRLGFEGTEKLGGGNSAIFRIESGFAADSGGGGLGTREAWLGAQGGWGAIKVGKQWTAYDDLYTAGIFSDNTQRNGIITSTTLWGNSGTFVVKQGAFVDTLSNSVRYELPNMSGFRGSLQYSTEENDNHDYILGGSLLYKNYGINSGIAYIYNKGARSEGFNDQALSAALGYDFGFMRVGGIYEHLQYEVTGGKLKRDLYGISTTVPVTVGSVWFFYGYSPDAKGPTGSKVGDVHAGNDTGVQQFSIAYNYPFSKRTSAYLGYIYLDNDTNSNYTFWRGGSRTLGQLGPSTTVNGVDQQGFTVGMYHMF